MRFLRDRRRLLIFASLRVKSWGMGCGFLLKETTFHWSHGV